MGGGQVQEEIIPREAHVVCRFTRDVAVGYIALRCSCGLADRAVRAPLICLLTVLA
jgi:hypothetical protein